MVQFVIRILNQYSTDKDIKSLFAYIAGRGSNEGTESIISVGGYGISNKYKKAAEQIIKIQKLYGKDNGRRCYQMIISFPHQMSDRNLVILIADAVSDMIFEEMHYQVFYGVHTSTDNLHIHFAINAVNYKSGKKWHQSNAETRKFTEWIRKRVSGISGKDIILN